jgi:hypothetical protein
LIACSLAHVPHSFTVRSRERLNTGPGFRAAASERMKRLNADPEFAAAASERMKRLNADPDFAAAKSEGMKRAFKRKRVAGLRRRRKTLTPEP